MGRVEGPSSLPRPDDRDGPRFSRRERSYAVSSVRERDGPADEVDFEACRLLLVAAAVCGSLSDGMRSHVSGAGACRAGEQPGAAFDRSLLVKLESSDAGVLVDVSGDV